MRIVFVLTYPTHHGIADRAEWLRWDNRDRRMPGILAERGVSVALWGLAREPLDTVSALPGIAPYPIRLFAPSNPQARTRDQVSDTLVAAARADPADLFVLIGSNGGAGFDLFNRVLRPDHRRFAVIIGGDWWSRIVPHAAFVFPESAVQEVRLAHPGRRFWRRAIPRHAMQRLPKTIDTERFAPMAADKRYDVIATSRLTPYKKFDEIAVLADNHRVAVIGDGPQATRLRARFPRVEWLGHVPNAQVPGLLAQARLFFHAGRRDYFPRAIPEAMACGLPVAAFDDRIGPDVIPPACGLLVRDGDYAAKVAALLADPAAMDAMGQAARAHVVATHGPRSSEAACTRLMELCA
ncbi:glycosyltransferase [Sphingomonas silueang]|uniref:glycosyltransferase n=1 Tax=Sphingomonas silueang TaxID=3156617 RepID=UPI0032B31A91